HPDVRVRAARGEPEPDARRDRPRVVGQPLPLHRLHEDLRSGGAGGERDARADRGAGAAMSAEREDGAMSAEREDGAMSAEREDGAMRAEREDGAMSAEREHNSMSADDRKAIPPGREMPREERLTPPAWEQGR